MVQKMYEAMKECLVRELEEVNLELVGISDESREKKDKNGKVLGDEKYVRVSVEIPRGNGSLSRCRFDVKIPNGIAKISQKQMNEGIFNVSFENLGISFIDSARNMVYFRADDYLIEEVK